MAVRRKHASQAKKTARASVVRTLRGSAPEMPCTRRRRWRRLNRPSSCGDKGRSEDTVHTTHAALRTQRCHSRHGSRRTLPSSLLATSALPRTLWKPRGRSDVPRHSASISHTMERMSERPPHAGPHQFPSLAPPWTAASTPREAPPCVVRVEIWLDLLLTATPESGRKGLVIQAIGAPPLPCLRVSGGDGKTVTRPGATRHPPHRRQSRSAMGIASIPTKQNDSTPAEVTRTAGIRHTRCAVSFSPIWPTTGRGLRGFSARSAIWLRDVFAVTNHGSVHGASRRRVKTSMKARYPFAL